MTTRGKHLRGIASPEQFFSKLRWLDDRPLLDTIEPYRAKIFEDALWTFDADGRPQINFVLSGRAKKNWKTSDLVLAGLYRFLVWPSAAGNDCFILASDEAQAGDDLVLAKKIIAANPMLTSALEVRVKEIIRRDGKGSMKILPAQDVDGLHGKSYLFCGYDEIHTYRSHDLFEALAPDPTRPDALQWITSYSPVRSVDGVPLHDFLQAGKRGDDPRMLFSWYAGDFTTDPALAGDAITPEQRANPSAASWGNDGYLEQQRRRLPTHKFRRLHLNLPGAPDGAAFDAAAVMSAIVTGRRRLPYDPEIVYVAFVDMSGGSNDYAVLCIAHRDLESERVVLDILVSQTGSPPFDPRSAVDKFAGVLKEYGCYVVHGDSYAGRTFRADFEARGVSYRPILQTKNTLYEAFEAPLLAGEVELLDVPQLAEQAATLVIRGGRIDHLPGDHDDYINATAGAVWLAAQREIAIPVVMPVVLEGPIHDPFSPNWYGGPSPYESQGDYHIGSLNWAREHLGGGDN